MSKVILTKCAECGDRAMAWDDERVPLCDLCGCSSQVPASIRFYIAYITGESRATCEECGFIWATWDCPCDFEHECEKGN